MTDSGILGRFSGARGETLVIEALKEQRLILGNKEASEEFLARGKIVAFSVGDRLVVEDDWSNGIFFILSGRVQISIMGFAVAQRATNQHVGEMALIDPSQPRAATVIAMEPTVAVHVSEEDFAAVASHHPDLWRQVAKEVADRLRQRRKFIRPSNPVPLVFVACASESLDVATEIQICLEAANIVVELWTDGVFKPSQHTMESLERKLSSVDFAIAIFSPDDKVASRGQKKLAPRDNTVFELGMFAGAIGRERSFYAVPAKEQVKVPSDLAGITSVRYNTTSKVGAKPNVDQLCQQVLERLLSLGPR